MESDQQRQKREWQTRRLARAKAEGKQQVAWLLPQDDLAIVDEIRDAHAYTNRDDAVSMVFAMIRNDPRLRKEFGL